LPIRDAFEGRQARPPLLGRIRLGVFDERKGYPQQSDTFVFTAGDQMYLQPLAREYGGQVERYTPQGSTEDSWRLISSADAITVLFPWGYAEANLQQWYELWSRLGLRRRCDGYDAQVMEVDEETGEITTEERPCVCAAMGERECSPRSRLQVWLPQTGLGLWEVSTGSKVAMFGLHDTLEMLDGYFAGQMHRIPIRLMYEPRRIRYFDERERKMRTTTKRVIAVGLAKPLPEILADLGAEPALGGSAVRELVSGTSQESPSGDALPSHPDGAEAGAAGDENGSSRGRSTETPPAAPASPFERYQRAVKAVAEAHELTDRVVRSSFVAPWCRDRRAGFPPKPTWEADVLNALAQHLEEVAQGASRTEAIQQELGAR
jgi:Recombination directionality factor-like